MRAGLLSGIIVLFFFSTSQAQITNEADFKKKFGLVDGYLYDGDYFKALPLAKELYAYDTTNANVNYMLGTCYLGADPDRKKAIYHLEQSVILSTPSPMYKEGDYKEKTAPGVAYYNLARAYHFVYRFDDAISNYYNYRSFIDLNDAVEYAQVKHQIEYSENAKLLIEEPVNIKVQSLGPVVNSKYEDYSPVISADGNTLIFTSRREGTTGGKLFLDGKFYEDIYIAKKEKGKWTTPRSIGANINTEGHEATIGLSPDGQQLFIYKDDNGDGNIYMSKLNGSEWSKPEKLGGDINTSAWETHATVSADGQNLFFVSNRNGGIGGRDIYKVSLLPDGTWGKAENLGPTINTQYDEEAPFFAADGRTLIFSSQGHNSMGGFDIFTSENIDGVWSTPVNIGYPINSPEDDVFFVTTPDGQFAYYSSRMEGGMGEKDIYLIELSEKKKESLTVMKGVIILENTSEINANIVVSDARTKAVTGIYKPHKQTGSYIFILQPGAEYNVSYECDGYETRTDKIVVPENSSYAEITRAVLLDPVVCGKGEVPLVVQNEQPKEVEKTAVEEKEDPKVAELKALEAQLLAEEKALKERQSEEARLAEEKRKAEETAKAKAEEEAKLAAEKKKAEELAAAKAAEEKKSAEAASKAKAEEEARLAEEKRKAEETAKAKAEEEAKLAAEKKKAEELAAAKAAEEKKLAEAAAKTKAEEEARLAEEKRKAEETAKTKAEEEAKLAAEKKKAEELAAAKAAEEKKSAEEAAKAKAKAEEQARLAEEKRKAEETAKAKAEEEAKLAAEKKKAEELAAAKAAEEKKLAEEAAKAKAEEQARLAEEKRKAEETAKLEAEKKRAEELAAAKAEQEKKQAEEAARIAEEKRKADEIAKAKAAEEAKLAAEKKMADELAAEKKKAFEDSLLARKNEIVKRLEELKKLQAQKSAQTAEETKAELAKAAADKKREEEKLAAEAKLAEDKRAAEEAAQKVKAEEQRKLAEKAAEEKRKAEELAAKQKAEADAKAQAEALANAKSIDELKKMNQALIAENELLKKQIAEGNKKIDQLTNQVEQQNKNYQELLAKFDEMQKQQKYQNAVQKTDFESFKKGESVVLKNIFFDYNLSIIRKESEEELQKLLAYMRENKGVKVEVSGHTDSHGNNEYNIELSRDRANSVVRYLTSRGIEASRLKSVGMGETQPIAINENPDGSDNPEGRQLNRRIEIRILNPEIKNIKVEDIQVPSDLKPKS